MNLIYTYWTNKAQNISCGFNYPQMFFEAAEISLKQSLSQYVPFDNIIIYTDNYGKEILLKNVKSAKKCKIIVVNYENYDFDKRFWNIPKLISYSLQNDFFIHIDFDVFLHHDFSLYISTDADILTELVRKTELSFSYLKYSLNKGIASKYIICSGLIGGKPLPIWKHNLNDAFSYITKYFKNSDVVTIKDLIGIEEYNFTLLQKQYKYTVQQLDINTYFHAQGAYKYIRHKESINQFKNKYYEKKCS